MRRSLNDFVSSLRKKEDMSKSELFRSSLSMRVSGGCFEHGERHTPLK